MVQPWRVLSDDLTGALDTAAAWAGGGTVPVFLDAPEASPATVQVTASGTRSVPGAELGPRLTPCLDWFTATGHAYKKVDSLLRGNTFAEVAWLLASGRFEGAIFAPALPSQGRFTAQDRHWVAPPHQPAGPHTYEHPQALSTAFAAHGLSVQLLARTPDALPPEGGVLIPSVLSEHELDRLAELAATPAAQRWLWCGSAGLAAALVRHTVQHNPPEAANDAEAPPVPARHGKPPALLITASRHPVLREQLHHLALLDTPIEVIDLAEPQPLTPEQAQTRLAQRLQTLVQHHRQAPAHLVVVGSDTLLALCHAASVRSLQAGPSPHPGWGHARLVGGVWDGVSCYSRAGAFGDSDDIYQLLATLTAARLARKEAHS